MRIKMWGTRHLPTHSLFLEEGHEYDLPESLGGQLIGQGLGSLVDGLGGELGSNLADKIIKPTRAAYKKDE